ncbi:MAG: iron-sulfur cluster assembly accessory protein [Candidatus Marinimicrobia bacterium]|nr:iron-sulfur cluster assembly accessory protein [Candidatus Neomarinimicrobiota bacterium]
MEKQNSSVEKAQNDFKNSQIFVTEKAVKRLKAVMSSEGKDNHFVRMSVDSGGCSGMNYKMDFEDNQGDYDKIFEINGLKVVCDLKSWLYLKNITIDYSDDMLNGGFKIENPNAERTCGCGTSFSA